MKGRRREGLACNNLSVVDRTHRRGSEGDGGSIENARIVTEKHSRSRGARIPDIAFEELSAL
jgi:hypothetical protein